MSSTRKHVFLGMPSYGTVSSAAALAFWGPCSQQHDVERREESGSLLAHNFNCLWAFALNRCLDAQPLDYFAMLHSDVQPPPGWLDVLIAELEARELDVLGAVVPIKSAAGVTSLALDRPDGDRWRPLCRLTLQEIHALPETFTSDDVGHRLLINTGCWVCRFDPEWAEEVHFEINDRLAYSLASKSWVAQVEPEDWNVSRQFHELGLKVGATRKLELTHQGTQDFPNNTPWGAWSYDRAFLGAAISFQPSAVSEGGRLPAES